MTNIEHTGGIDGAPAGGAEWVPTGNTYDKYNTSNPIERRMMKGFFDTLDAFVDATRPTRILEVGLGEGIVSERLRARFPAASIVGIDLADVELGAHWHERDLAAAFADVEHLPFPDDAFDLVVAIEVFEHFPHPERPSSSWTGSPRTISSPPCRSNRSGAWATWCAAATCASWATPPGTSITGAGQGSRGSSAPIGQSSRLPARCRGP